MSFYQNGILISGVNTLPELTRAQYEALPVDKRPEYWVCLDEEYEPTNIDADEINFNNEDTDLVSKKVGSAIKEVNAKVDKGGVSVTADGDKTNADMFAELASLLDYSKLTNKSVLRMNNTILNVEFINVSENTVVFIAHNITSSEATLVQSGVSTTPTSCYYLNVEIGSGTPPTWTFKDRSSNTPTPGLIYSITY